MIVLQLRRTGYPAALSVLVRGGEVVDQRGRVKGKGRVTRRMTVKLWI